jgi:HD-GYP domain-containing protein (c-di-GMP phosphodiesterase class II)
MRKIFNHNLKEHLGCVLAKDVSWDGNVIFRAGTVLEKENIQTLQKDFTYSIPVLFIRTGESIAHEQQEEVCEQFINESKKKIDEIFTKYDRGAVDFKSIKNITDNIVLHLVKNHAMVMNLDSILNYGQDIMDHSFNTCIIATILGVKSGRFSSELLEDLAIGALLHDIGKIPLFGDYPELNDMDRIYSNDDYEKMKQHTIIGYNALKDDEGLSGSVKKAALMHHIWERPEESYDASLESKRSYPDDYEGRILLPSNKGIFVSIIQVADSFEWMTNRLSTGGVNKKDVIRNISESEENIFGEGAGILVKFMYPYGIGDMVALNNGLKAVVIDETDIPERPIVKVTSNCKIINLATSKNISILKEIQF